MAKNHITRLDAPTTWPIKKKGITWIVRPYPSGHRMEHCIPISVVLRTMMNHAKTMKEVKIILNNRKVMVNKRFITESKAAAGLMDVVEIPECDEYYRLIINKKGKFMLIKISKEESSLIPRKVLNKTIVKGNKIQLNLSGGANFITDNKEYKTGDTLIIDMDSKSVKEHLKFTEGAQLYLLGGSHIGCKAELSSIKQPFGATKINIKIANKEFETFKKFAIVLNDNISVENK